VQITFQEIKYAEEKMSSNVRLFDKAGAVEAIKKLGEEDLVFLNRLIVERLKLISQARSTQMMAHFTIGDRVHFRTSAGETKNGIISRLNKKTASIITDDGQSWNVAPGLLMHLKDAVEE
jgi:hypothetical protein